MDIRLLLLCRTSYAFGPTPSILSRIIRAFVPETSGVQRPVPRSLTPASPFRLDESQCTMPLGVSDSQQALDATIPRLYTTP
jgi:hypothetical protein